MESFDFFSILKIWLIVAIVGSVLYFVIKLIVSAIKKSKVLSYDSFREKLKKEYFNPSRPSLFGKEKVGESKKDSKEIPHITLSFDEKNETISACVDPKFNHSAITEVFLEIYEEDENGTQILILQGKKSFNVEQFIATVDLSNVIIKNGDRAASIKPEDLIAQMNKEYYTFDTTYPLPIPSEEYIQKTYNLYKLYYAQNAGGLHYWPTPISIIKDKKIVARIGIVYYQGANLSVATRQTLSLENINIK